MNTSELQTAIFYTLCVCTLSAAGAVPLGTLLAVLLRRTDVPGRGWAWLAIGSQLAVPLYVFAGSWSAGFGLQGWLRFHESYAGDREWLWSVLDGRVGAVLAVSVIHALAAIPWVVLIVSLGLVHIHRGQEETALIDGGPWHWLRFGLAPKLRIWIAASCLWCFVPVLTEMVVTNLYQVPTVAEQVYLDASRGELSPWTYIAAVALCALPLLLAGEWWRRRQVPWSDLVYRAAHHRGERLTLGSARPLVGLGLWCVVLLLVALPLVNLLIKAGWQPQMAATGESQFGWSWTRLATTFAESITLYQDHFVWSALLAAGSTGLAAALAIGLRGWLSVSSSAVGGHGPTVINSIALAMIAVPGPLAGMLIIALMNRSQPAWLGMLYDRTLTAPILAQQFRIFPLAWVLSGTVLANLSRGVWEQALLDGLGPWQRITHVVWPQTWSRWLLMLLILFVMSIGELSCTILVLPPGVTTLSMRLFEMLHFGMRHQDSGLCFLLIGLSWLVSLLAWKTLNER